MQDLRIVKRNGEVVPFDLERIRNAIRKAVVASNKVLSDDRLDTLVESIREEIQSRFIEFFPNVENIQDIVEKHLVKAQHYEIAKTYILYRAEREKLREQARERAVENAKLGRLTVTKRDGRTQLLNVKKVHQTIQRASSGLGDGLLFDDIVREVIKNIFDGVSTEQLERAMVLAAAAYIERDPDHSLLAGRLLLQRVYKEVMGRSIRQDEFDDAYRETFVSGIKDHVEKGNLHPKLAEMDLERLSAALRPERDLLFQYLGIQTLHERYFIKDGELAAELPQGFWMRTAMGLAIEEDQPEDWAIEFYELLSQLLYVASTPTLFHSGTAHPQLSSCYLTTIDDDLKHIFKSLGDNSQLSKWSGGIGNDWSNIRATGAAIRSTKVESQGVVPFLKIANDVTNAINRSGKRRGATCAYLETWHYDIEDFLDLRKNTGDERRRTHDMNTANWIPDLFMKRVMNGETWTLFSPDEVEDLHHIYGRKFEERYLAYEQMAEEGKIHLYKQVDAKTLWRKMLTMLFETGHPWMTFKDPCNIRSPQDHVGVIHSSNLCTEITLNTSAEETAVCNLGSINLSRHIEEGGIDEGRLARTVRTAIRMLDNVININFYPTAEARHSNLQHRPIGLGVMGFQDALLQMDLPFESEEALVLADTTQEIVAYNAIYASSMLAKERGAYPSYEGSKWDRGIFPLDTIDMLELQRGVPIEVSRTSRLDWRPVREHVAQYGMRNSNTMAIAPTATISNISGCFPCIEPLYKNIYVKANISGEFTIVNHYLVSELKEMGLWNEEMLDQLKYFDGNISNLVGIPDSMKRKYKEAFQIDPIWALRLTAARGKWIDQSQSHNVFMLGTSGKLLADIYMSAWKMGLKTTYYLRTLAATQIEKSTLDASKYGYTQMRDYSTPMAAGAAEQRPTAMGTTVVANAAAPAAMQAATPSPATLQPGAPQPGAPQPGAPQPGAPQPATQEPSRTTGADGQPQLCRIDDPDCEACQ